MASEASRHPFDSQSLAHGKRGVVAFIRLARARVCCSKSAVNVMPAQAGIQRTSCASCANWIPACARMTPLGNRPARPWQARRRGIDLLSPFSSDHPSPVTYLGASPRLSLHPSPLTLLALRAADNHAARRRSSALLTRTAALILPIPPFGRCGARPNRAVFSQTRQKVSRNVRPRSAAARGAHSARLNRCAPVRIGDRPGGGARKSARLCAGFARDARGMVRAGARGRATWDLGLGKRTASPTLTLTERAIVIECFVMAESQHCEPCLRTGSRTRTRTA